MSKSSKIVDLEMSSDGSYSPKGIKNTKVVAKKFKDIQKEERYNKNHVITEADMFLSGIDVGLDLLDEVIPRVDRFLRLRG